ncbi:MAG: hypothetical protein ACRCZY_01345 [Phocaeicola sp.]
MSYTVRNSEIGAIKSESWVKSMKEAQEMKGIQAIMPCQVVIK